MTTTRFEVGDTKCADDEQALLLSCPKGTIISLLFDSNRASRNQVHELDRLLGKMGLMAVKVQMEEPKRVIQAVRKRVRPRPGRGGWTQA